MQNLNFVDFFGNAKSILCFEEDVILNGETTRKKFGKAGVLIFLKPPECRSLCDKINEILNEENPENNEVFNVCNQNITNKFSFWNNYVGNTVIDKLVEFNEQHLREEYQHLIKREIMPNCMLKNLLKTIKVGYDIHYINDNWLKIRDWETIIGIEALKNDNADRYKSNNFSYFGGNVKNIDNNIFDTVKRELLEEAHIKLSDKIWNDEYQDLIRLKYGLSIGKKCYLDFGNYHSKVYIIFIEYIKIIPMRDISTGKKFVRIQI